MEVLATAIRQGKEIIGILTGKEELKLSLFADDMILYREYHKDPTKELLEQINKFSKILGYKINIPKSVAYLYTTSKVSEREIKKTIPFTITSKRKIHRNKFYHGDVTPVH